MKIVYITKKIRVSNLYLYEKLNKLAECSSFTKIE